MTAVAVLMAGELRSFPQIVDAHVEQFRKLRASFDVSLFIHLWHSSETELRPQDLELLQALDPARVSMEWRPDQFDKKYVFSWPTGRAEDERMALGMASMWTAWDRAWSMMEEHEASFDLVVRTRPDAIWDISTECRLAVRTGVARFPRRVAAVPQPSDIAFVLPFAEARPVMTLVRDVPRLDSLYWAQKHPKLVPEFVLGVQLARNSISWDHFGSGLALIRSTGKVLWTSPRPIDYLRRLPCAFDSDEGPGSGIFKDLSAYDALSLALEKETLISKESARVISRIATGADRGLARGITGDFISILLLSPVVQQDVSKSWRAAIPWLRARPSLAVLLPGALLRLKLGRLWAQRKFAREFLSGAKSIDSYLRWGA